MGLLPLFAQSTSFGSIVELLIYICVTGITYWALQRIITGAGYSNYWMALPASTMLFTWICYIIFWSDIHGIYFGSGFDFGFSGISQVNVVWTLDEISIVANWIFFLVIAFSGTAVSDRLTGSFTSRSTLPAQMNSGLASTLAPPPNEANVVRPMPPSAAGPVNAGRPAPPSAAGPIVRPAPPSAAGPGGAPAGAAPRPGAQYCAWCGESLPGNRALFHDCGPKDRPETNCRTCGTTFPAGSTQCASCAAV
jgi:hypothetical protein